MGSVTTASIAIYGERIDPSSVVGQRKTTLQASENAYILFDDTVLDKRYSASIELTRRQYSGNEHRVRYRVN